MRLGTRARFQFIQFALIALPALPLGYLCIRWVPRQVRAGQLESRIGTLSKALDARGRELDSLRARLSNPKQSERVLSWLPQRDTRHAFNAVTAALGGEGVRIDRLNVLDPVGQFGVDERVALFQERFEIACVGDFHSLGAALSKLTELEIPCRITALTMKAADQGVSIELTANVPYRFERETVEEEE